MKRFDRLWVDVHLATLEPGGDAYGTIPDGALAVRHGRIAWLGPRDALPGAPADLAGEVVEGAGGWLTPGLIDCHTHLVYGGSRAGEFADRLAGMSYAEIARRGGGIRSTVRATRALDESALLAAALPRARALAAEGVTTVEIKSGYGLDLDTELRQLRVARAIGDALPLNVTTTLLAAHAVPPEYDGRAKDYVGHVCDTIIPAVARAGLAQAVDAFCEPIAFSAGQCDRVLAAARAHGLPVKLHAEQLSSSGGAELAARHGALSADHVEYLDDAGIAALARAGTVAVLLPGAFYFLRETRLPPVAALRAAGVPMALATDLNPGTSPIASLRLMLNMGCVLFGLMPAEAIAGVTRNAARALGLAGEIGTLAAGKRADMALWDIAHPDELSYLVGINPLRQRILSGRIANA